MTERSVGVNPGGGKRGGEKKTHTRTEENKFGQTLARKIRLWKEQKKRGESQTPPGRHRGEKKGKEKRRKSP